jgi:hypothetical protein
MRVRALVAAVMVMLGEPQRVQIEFQPAPSDDWIALPDQPVTDGRGYFTATIAQPQAGEYRFQWIRPEPAAPSPAPAGGGPFPASEALALTG